MVLLSLFHLLLHSYDQKRCKNHHPGLKSCKAQAEASSHKKMHQHNGLNSEANLRVLWTFPPKTRDDVNDLHGFLSKKVEAMHVSLHNWQCQGVAPVRCPIHSTEADSTKTPTIHGWHHFCTWTSYADHSNYHPGWFYSVDWELPPCLLIGSVLDHIGLMSISSKKKNNIPLQLFAG